MKITIDVEVHPFPVPTHVAIRKGPTTPLGPIATMDSLSLSNLPVEVLNALCDEFRDKVFAAAGYPPPLRERPSIVAQESSPSGE